MLAAKRVLRIALRSHFKKNTTLTRNKVTLQSTSIPIKVFRQPYTNSLKDNNQELTSSNYDDLAKSIHAYTSEGRLHLAKKLVIEGENASGTASQQFHVSASRLYSYLGEMDKAFSHYLKIEEPVSKNHRFLLRACSVFGSIPSNHSICTEILTHIVGHLCKSETLDQQLLKRFILPTRPEMDIFRLFKENNVKIDQDIIEALISIGSFHGDFDFALISYNTGYRLGIRPTTQMMNNLLLSTYPYSHAHRISPLFIVYEIARAEYINHGLAISDFFKRSFSYLLAIHPNCKELPLKRIEDNIGNTTMETSVWIKYADSWVEAYNDYTNSVLVENNHDDNFLSSN